MNYYWQEEKIFSNVNCSSSWRFEYFIERNYENSWKKKKKKGGFSGMLLGTSKASLLTGKEVWRIGYEDMKEKEY